jgi:hypothetical protein
MKEYFFYREFDQLKEPIGVGKFISIREAYTLFAERKDMNINQFTKLFKVAQR